MIWEKKAEMVRLGNRINESLEARKEFQRFVLENVEEFDLQTWDMFANLSTIILDEMKEDVDYWKEIYPHLIKIDCNDERFGLRSGMRIGMLQSLCEELN